MDLVKNIQEFLKLVEVAVRILDAPILPTTKWELLLGPISIFQRNIEETLIDIEFHVYGAAEEQVNQYVAALRSKANELERIDLTGF